MQVTHSKHIHTRQGDTYLISEDDIRQFDQQGYIVLRNVLSEKELCFIDTWFEHFISGKERSKMARDFCDMSQPYGTALEDFQLINAMLPSTYRPELSNNVFYKVAQNIANQLYRQKTAALDYEQFLAKKPNKHGAQFSMHQDLGYWPKTSNTWTATFSLALSPSDLTNGCLQVVPGSNKEKTLRRHLPKIHEDSDDNATRDNSHALVIEDSEHDHVEHLIVNRGDVTVHDERIVHGSGGNRSDKWRKTYVMAFRDEQTIAEERAMGFTHSHNDKLDWNAIIKNK
ncbi:phytanoyl-CoA dioxygenase family protein [Ningiella sp. W23]|uniref:phytanoyl-CoA dioxygenase family protein n=1 Tax=Ningiella sp. W23 TaxID=3023715 RepID=UPI003757AAED